jgi:hypothetical protein
MKTTIKKAKACKESWELFNLADDLSQALGDSEAGLFKAELDRDWDSICHYVGMVAHWKYLYNYVYDMAGELEEFEHECKLSSEIDNEMMGDRI